MDVRSKPWRACGPWGGPGIGSPSAASCGGPWRVGHAIVARASTTPRRRSPGSPHCAPGRTGTRCARSEEHTSELQSRLHLVCRLLLEKKKKKKGTISAYTKLFRSEGQTDRVTAHFASQ